MFIIKYYYSLVIIKKVVKKMKKTFIIIFGVIILLSIGYMALNIDFSNPAKVKYIDDDKSLNKANTSKLLVIEITSEADIIG